MQGKQPLEPVEEHPFHFQGIEISAARLADGFGYVSLNSLCDAFGLNRQAQRRRLISSADYFDTYSANIQLTTAGGKQSVICLRADAVPLFLTGIQINRIASEEARHLLLAFLEEAHIILAEHFGLSERGEIQMHRAAIARMMARQQALEELVEARFDLAEAGFRTQMERRADEIQGAIRTESEAKLDQVRAAFAGLRGRIQTLESIAGPKERLTPEQLGQLKQSVNTLGMLKMEVEDSVRPFPGIYADVFSLVGVSRSEHIPQGMFQRVLDFLDGQIEVLQRKKEAKQKNAG